jgi:PiT family inorganic phosphate transporter
VLGKGAVSKSAQIPLWVMMVGAIGICLGLALFGPKLIRTVGSEITELDQTRAFCIAMSATITVIIASQLACRSFDPYRRRWCVRCRLPAGISRSSYARMVDDILAHHPRRCRADQGLPAPLRPGDAAGKGCHARPAEA